MKVAIVGGAGHVGLPLGVVLADAGHYVRAIDSDPDRVQLIAAGRSPFKEPGLDELLKVGLDTKRFTIGTDISVVSGCDVVFVVVGTDLDERDSPQNDSVLSVIGQLRRLVSPSATVVLRSTVMPGTTARSAELLHGLAREVVFCPERIAEGRALEELRAMPQLVGTATAQSSSSLSDLFGSIGVETIPMTWKEAELGKLILNTWRYSQFAIANEFRRICESQEVSYRRVRESILRGYPRGVGLMGPGLAGGPCLRKDTLQLLADDQSKSELLRSVIDSHQRLISEVVEEVHQRRQSESDVVVQLGLTFKPGSDDLRGSVALELAVALSKEYKNFQVVDPYVQANTGFTHTSLEAAIEVADVLVVGTRHPEFLDQKFSIPCIDLGGFRVFSESGRVE